MKSGQTNKRALVVGGSGFLGSHVADELSDRGFSVAIFDVQPSAHLRADQEMVVGSVLDQEAIERAAQGCNLLYNFAGIADIDECARRPVDTVKVNILGQTHVLEAARKAEVERYLFASTAYVYARAGSFYRVSKQASELLIEAYSNDFGLSHTILRYGSLYGPRCDHRNSIYRYLSDALRNGRIDYRGTGEEVREPIHVRDAARLSVDVLSDEYIDQHVLLTGPQTFKYKDLLTMVAEIVGPTVEVKYHPSESKTHYRMTPYSFQPKHGRKLLSNPFVDLGEGMLEILQHIDRDAE